MAKQLSHKEKTRLREKFGDWALITGASSGIGLELARLLAEAGFNLVLNGRDALKLKGVADDFRKYYPIKIIEVAADVSESNGIEAIIRACEFHEIGIFIASAGFGTSGHFLESNLDNEINMVRVNCEGVLSLTHHFGNRFKTQKYGGIVFLSSLVAFQGVPFSANYAATKAYVQTLSEGLAVELQPFGIDVLAAAPGPVSSGFGERALMQMGKSMHPSELGIPILKALGRTSTVVPGSLSKILTYPLAHSTMG